MLKIFSFRLSRVLSSFLWVFLISVNLYSLGVNQMFENRYPENKKKEQVGECRWIAHLGLQTPRFARMNLFVFFLTLRSIIQRRIKKFSPGSIFIHITFEVHFGRRLRPFNFLQFSSWATSPIFLLTCFQSWFPNSSSEFHETMLLNPLIFTCRKHTPILSQGLSNISVHQKQLVSLLQHSQWGPIPQMSDSVGQE